MEYEQNHQPSEYECLEKRVRRIENYNEQLEHNLAHLNGAMAIVVREALRFLRDNKLSADEPLEQALQALGDNTCHRPPGCYPDPRG